MNIRSMITRIKNRFKELLKYKIFRYALLIHAIYFILSILLVFVFFREQNDFLVYYTAGGIFLNDIEDLYVQENYLWNFRYFPLSAVLFIPFYVLGFDIGFTLFHIINLILNILICLILYKILILVRGEGHEKDDKRIITYISLYLMSLPQIFNYILGQINLYITLLILLSLYIFLKHEELKWQFLGSLVLGISLLIKPIGIFLIPFLLIINYDYVQKRIMFDFPKSAIRLIGVIIPIMGNFILFLLYPSLWEGFLATNLTGPNPVDLNFSFSITKLLVNFFYFYNISFSTLRTFLIVTCIVGGYGFIAFLFRKRLPYSIIYGYLLGIIIMLLVYFDSWDHHLLTLIPILIIFIFILPRNSDITKNYIKPSFFFFSFLDLAFTGLWFLTKEWFPFNFASTIFLLLTFIGMSKYFLSNKDINYKEVK